MDSVSGVGVIDKAVAILTALAAGPVDLAGLQEVSGLPRATAHRLAVALEQHHLVRRDGAGRFCLGAELISLGRAAGEQFGLVEVARPVLRDLRDRTGESVQLYVLEEPNGRRCLLSLQSAHGLRWIVPEGSVLPLGVGSAGHVLSGDDVGTGGWIDSVEEREPGVASVSAPVRDGAGRVVAAVSLSGPLERLSRAPGERFGAAVADAAVTLASLLRR